MTVTDVDRTRARLAAQFAAVRGLPVTVCPYSPTGDDRVRALALTWVRAYLAAAPPDRITVDYTD